MGHQNSFELRRNDAFAECKEEEVDGNFVGYRLVGLGFFPAYEAHKPGNFRRSLLSKFGISTEVLPKDLLNEPGESRELAMGFK